MHETEYDEFFRAAYPRLVAFGMATSATRDVACELAQETMLRAFHRRDELATFDAPYAWCRRVMSNLLIDHHRAATTEQGTVTRLHSRRSTSDGTADDPALAATTPRWSELIAPLTGLQRTVATLYYAEDQPVGVIADALAIAPGTVKSTLSKARENLRRHLAGTHQEMRT
ncbi:MAG: sigma-70 family RNA polymerase sigma factor [Ilumatobacteraceae bacterium]